MQDKIQIFIRCNHCDNGVNSLDPEDTYASSDHRKLQTPCPLCRGSGGRTRWISLEQLAILLHACQCPHEHTSFQGGFHFTEGDVWDDIVEVCDDCGARLE